MVTLREAANFLGVHYQTVRNYAKRGLLHTRKFIGDKHVYVTQQSVLDLQDASRIKRNSIGVLAELHMKVSRLERKVSAMENQNPIDTTMRDTLTRLHG
jgi:predicted site-specific integrase-resolvase